MSHRDTKQAEKEYLQRTGAGEWERWKPFAPPGSQASSDAAELIHDFAVMLRLLQPGPQDLILDLGAGGCWCSDWLQRLNLRTVSVDIAVDMLSLGRTRLPAAERARLAAGDMEALPFASGSFDRACCLSALHHVPSIPKALAEIRRVLAPHGRVVFLEPGKGHSRTPQSLAAMRDFGVLEQDILVEDLMRECLEAGFAHVQIQPIAYVIPNLGLTLEEFGRWSAAGRRKRPLRAAMKMWRAMLEVLGLGKQGALFEETFAIQLVRTLKGAMDDSPAVVAYRTVPQPGGKGWSGAGSYRARWEVPQLPPPIEAGGPLAIRIRVHNEGTETWRAATTPPTRVGLQLLAADRQMVDRDFARASLPRDVAPGQSCELTVAAAAPGAGSYHLKLDVVVEGVTWFEPTGSAVNVMPLEVGPPAAGPEELL